MHSTESYIQYLVIPIIEKNFFCFLGPYLQHMEGGSWARDQTGATAAGLGHSHSNARSKLRLQPTPQLTAMRDP